MVGVSRRDHPSPARQAQPRVTARPFRLRLGLNTVSHNIPWPLEGEATAGERAPKMLRQIEHEEFGAVDLPTHGESGFVLGRRAVAGIQAAPVRFNRAANDLKPALASRLQRVRHLLAGIQDRGEQLHVLVDDDRAVASVAGAYEAQPAALFGIGERLLVVTGGDTLAGRYDPNLQKVHRLGLRVIDLAMANASTGRHDLHLARPDDRSGADAVLVL